MNNFSKRMLDLKGSPVRAMLSTSMQPDVISFAGGLPSEDSFFKFSNSNLFDSAMQYGPSEGEAELRNLIAQDLNKLDINCDANQILILSGSQQGIDLVAKLMIDNGTKIAVESPTYLAALQVFRFFGASFDELPEDFETITWTKQNHPSLAYIIPTFQNPTGKSWSENNRKYFANKCENNNVIIFEDDPYRDLVFDDCPRTPVVSYLESGSWIYQGSFSKILSPGLRIGYIAASKDLLPYLLLLKQAADLHTNRLSQYMVIDFLKSSKRANHLKTIIDNYKTKRDNFAELLQKYLGNTMQWQIPNGGLFFWLRLNDEHNIQKIFEAAKNKNVLFTPGEHFFANHDSAYPAMRLNFSHSSLQDAEKGLRVLGDILNN